MEFGLPVRRKADSWANATSRSRSVASVQHDEMVVDMEVDSPKATMRCERQLASYLIYREALEEDGLWTGCLARFQVVEPTVDPVLLRLCQGSANFRVTWMEGSVDLRVGRFV